MRQYLRLCFVAIATVCALGFSLGCQRSSHMSVRTYEYNDDKSPRPANDEPTSEYEMQSPGEMVAPGDMVNEP
jgi:hypothetical protein